MATPLPFENKLKMPRWSGKLNAETMQTGSHQLKLPIGLNPMEWTSTFEWFGLSREDAKTVLAEFASKAYNGTYSYTDLQEGPCFIRPTGEGVSYVESHAGHQSRLTAEMRKL